MNRLNYVIYHFVSKISVLAILYIISGKLGLYLAIPPGYATIIWPPSGIALGVLILAGWRLWPGIFIGSFLLNCYISFHSQESMVHLSTIMVALFIAIGSTLQAIAGFLLIRFFVGIPLRLNYVSQLLKIFLVTTPIACIMAATISTTTLYLNNLLPASALITSWVTWWAGDALGILVFLPLVLITPLSINQSTWRGNQLTAVPAFGILISLILVGITFYSWKIVTENQNEKTRLIFNNLVSESENALINRFNHYDNALLASEGLFKASKLVTRPMWRDYVITLDLGKNYPAANGLGFIAPVNSKDMPSFLKSTRNDQSQNFIIHPSKEYQYYFIIKYLEPENLNLYTLGLNIAFERNRLAAAIFSRDSGTTTITDKIMLIQDDLQSPSFFILHPIYAKNSPLLTKAQRQNAFEGWVYLPIIANKFFKNLTKSQTHDVNLSIYENIDLPSESLIYVSNDTENSRPPVFTLKKSMIILGKKWLVVWESTPAFEKTQENLSSTIIIVVGLIFTGLFAIFLLFIDLKKISTTQSMASVKGYILPLSIFILITLGSLKLFYILRNNERYYLKQLIESEANKIEMLITSQINDKLFAMKRMAQRWVAANGTPKHVWQVDALNYTQQLTGLNTIEWVDSTYHIRWVEPLAKNTTVIGLYILFDKQRELALKNAAQANLPTLTPPMKLVQGYDGFVGYYPIIINNQFDGFIAGVFSIQDFFGKIITKEVADNFEFNISYDGKDYYQYNSGLGTHNEWLVKKTLKLWDKAWTLHIKPTQKFLSSQQSYLANVFLICGLLIAFLSALIVRFMIISRLKSNDLATSSKQIKESEERYDLVVKGMSVGLWDWKIPTGEMYWTEKLLNMFGIFDKDFKPDLNYFSDHLHPDDKEITLTKLNNHLLRKGPYDVEYRIQDGPGHYSWFHASGQAQWDKDNNPIRMAGSVTNITDRIEAAIALEESNNLKMAILAAAKHMIIAANPEGIVSVFNEAAERALGYKASEIIGKQTPALWHDPQEVANKAAILSQTFQTTIQPGFDVFTYNANLHGLEESEWTFIRKDKSQFPVKLTVTSLKNYLGEITGYLGVIEDITEQHKAELALKKSEETFRSAIDNASIGMALVNPNGQWMKVNRALCTMLGYTATEFLDSDFQAITYPDDLVIDSEFIKKMLAGEINQYQMEKRYYHKSGKLIWALLNVSIVHDEQGQPNYFISQIQDISDRKEMEKIKNDLISVVSHELRTPLTSIRGSLGLMAGTMSTELSDKANHLIKIAYKNSERLILLINDMLDIDKIDSGRMRFNMQIHNLNDLMNQAIESNQPYAQKFDITLQLNTIDPEIAVLVDEDRFLQIMSNLLSNAIKFSTPKQTVYIRASILQQHVKVIVENDGIGIPETFHSQIFSKFSQADSSSTRTKEGTGLGLHISKQLIEQMNGSIGFESETNKKTCFWIQLPLHSTGQIISKSQKTSITENIDSIKSSLPLILHVEDDIDLSTMLAVAMQDKCKIIVAGTIAQANQLVQQHTFDMIILDLVLPDGSGINFLNSLSTETLQSTIITILSAHEPPKNIFDQVAAVMIKSRISETKIIQTILTLLSPIKKTRK